MVDPLSQQIVQDIGKTSVSQSPEPSTVSAEDAASFQSMVGADTSAHAVQPTQQTEFTGGMSEEHIQNMLQATERKQSPSLGDRILQGLENSHNEVQAAREKVVSQIQGDGTINKMYELQLQVSQLSTNQQILGQVGSKTSQGVQTLLKGQ